MAKVLRRIKTVTRFTTNQGAAGAVCSAVTVRQVDRFLSLKWTL